MIVIFTYFMISALGLGLFMLTRTYRQWSSYKSDAVLLRAAAENGVRSGFGALEGTLAARAFPLALTEEEYNRLRAATLAGQTDVVAAALGVVFPLIAKETAGWSEWASEAEFQPVRVADSESFFAAEFAGTIDARGRLTRRLQAKRTVLDIGLSVMAGRVPLSAFPFLLAGENGRKQAAELLAGEKVVLTPPETGGGQIPPAATDLLLVPADAAPQLAETLRIRIFSPDKLTIFQLRQALGLPLVNEPVPDGVYLVVNDFGLGGVFIQGDVEEMILAADSGRQYFQFRLEEGLWRMWFNPSERQTEFSGPEESRRFERTPLPIVMVNGSIASLGGGIVVSDGILALSGGTDAPSVLAGVSLTIVSAGETVISTHLIQEGVHWKDGLPYLKDSTAQLFLYASGRDFVTGAGTAGRIRVGADAPADLFLQASLAARDGVRIDGKGQNVTISGSIQASGLELGDARLTIRPDDRLLSPLAPGNTSPRATDPVLFVSGWEALQWSDR
ncbi:MAG: hypothetical protein NTW38_09600 [Candidatus Aminicenantes bacterium]|nr:hypothetical protein [Candidatus Aminicenantes bacterium]